MHKIAKPKRELKDVATKKESLQHQMKTELYRQYYDARGTSRHEEKQKRGEYEHLDKIYARNSLKAHLSRAEQFAKWLKAEHAEVKRLDDITRDIAGEYLKSQQERGYSVRTIESDMTAINHLQLGRSHWEKEEALNKREFDIRSRRAEDITNNRGERATPVTYSSYQERVVAFGEAFGLRRSEVVPERKNNDHAVTTNSFFRKDERIYLATIGKGGRFRTVECLESRQAAIEAEYGQYIRDVEQLPDRQQFREEYARENQLFNSVSNNVRIHVDCRQFYANEKLNELEESERRFELTSQNSLRSGYDKYTTNNRTMLRDHAQYVSQQLGHNRLNELKSYINLN